MRIASPADLPDRDPGLMPPGAVIAIDGPAGSGKSTTAKALAERFGLLYIDTGAMYRALTLAALRAKVDLEDEAALAAMLAGADLELRPGRGEVTVLWNGEDVSQAIRTPEVDAAVSPVSAHAAVRADMVRRQQRFGRRGGVVMEGRDIGSVVFPLATAKIYLMASLEARVERRVRQFRQRGREVAAEDVSRDLAERDRLDSERATSPLAVCPDALVVDSSGLSLADQNEACARAALVNPALDLDLDTDLETSRRGLPFHYRLAFAVFGALARFYGLRQVGLEGKALPRGTIVACNHVSLWDPPLMGATLRRHPVHTLAKEELFRPRWLMGRFFRWLDSIPIRRKGYDRAAFGEARDALEAGHNLLIFPEGTRRAIGHPGPVKNGLGILVQATRAPLLPMLIRGSYGRQPGGSILSPLEVRYGPVIRWHALDLLLEQEDPKLVSRRIAHVCEAAWRELQERSYADRPRTAFERDLGEVQIKRFARRHERLFGREKRPAAT
jgi:cytidylate kinase